jgi:LuxR family maltose regulon positive regulatory protein
MRADAELALTLIAVGSLWRAPAQLLLGIAQLLAGDLGVADDVLAEAIEVAQDTGATVAVTVALAERALLAIGRQDWQDAETLVEQARLLVESAHLEDCVTSVVVYGAAARVAIHHGNLDQARQDLARAQQLRPQATHALPYYAVQARLELVRAYLALTDVAAAQSVFREVDDLLRWRPDLGTLRDQANQLRAQLDHLRGDLIGLTSLTTVLGQRPTLVAAAGLGHPGAQPGVAAQLLGRREPGDVAQLGGDGVAQHPGDPGAVSAAAQRGGRRRGAAAHLRSRRAGRPGRR